MTLLLCGGTLVDPSQNIERVCDLLIEKGRIARIGKIEPQKGWRKVDLSGLVVCPGLVDMHVHFREPGQEEKETIETGSRAAVAGGFTSVACMPNTAPVNDCEAVTRFMIEKARDVNLANVHPVGAITKSSQGKELAEIGQMVKSGALAISDDGMPVQNSQVMRRAMEYARIFDVPVLDHCEEPNLAAGGCMNESSVSTELGLRGLNGVAEEMHVVRDLILSRLTGAHVHICHISTAESVDWVRRAKEQGVSVTCEVTPHHLSLADEALRNYDTNYKMNPPLRTRRDLDALLEALADGTIDCIATDHAPHHRLDKEVTFEEAANGIIGLESSVPVCCEFLIGQRVISLSRLVELMSVNPSRILKLDRGTLREGSVADITVLDPARDVTIDVESFKSKSRNCPYDGMRLHGQSMMTIVKGRIVWHHPGIKT